ncbi:MAG: CocE/NonD family hydrolase [Acidobacteriota bacterium]|nr:CocE/NonD family hydrolase [Acidobacteriota bacterium]
MGRSKVSFARAGAYLTLTLVLVAAAMASPADQKPFALTHEMIRMRDGVRLHTAIFIPRGKTGPFPILLIRSPYGLDNDAKLSRDLETIYSDLSGDGYIFAFQDIRGRYLSEGHFVMQREPCEPERSGCIDEGTDAYDTVAWLVKNAPGNNGRVGMFGVSYGGWLVAMAMIHPNPALKAVSEQASPDDMFIGDDFHHNGAFRLSYAFEYAAEMERGKTNNLFHFSRYDTYEWYLFDLGPLSNANKLYFHGQVPTWNNFVDHPNYDAFWRKEEVSHFLTHVTVPDLNVAGWWDQEDFYGPVRIFETLEKNDPHHWNFLIAGPWNHGGWTQGPGRKLGRIDFGSDTGKRFREIEAQWFRYWLKGEGKLPFAKALTFQTGSNRWVAYEEWPPKNGVVEQKLYLRSNRRLSFGPPSHESSGEFDSYISDPAKPVPYRHRPVEETYGPGSRWYTWLVEDQRFADNRPDTMSWETPPLTQNITVSGDIVAHLFASTTGSDSDWVVKLIDVYPEIYPQAASMAGYELMIADEVFRARFRHSFEHPEAVTPGKVTPYVIDLHTTNHSFLKGHRIMVQVQSTWFPLIDCNPQTYAPNIFLASQENYRAATQRIYRSPEFASYLALPVAISTSAAVPAAKK